MLCCLRSACLRLFSLKTKINIVISFPLRWLSASRTSGRKKTETIYVLPAMRLQEIENKYREKKHVLLSYLLINNRTPIFVVTAFAAHLLLVVAKLVTSL